jgi:hypothetical protein
MLIAALCAAPAASPASPWSATVLAAATCTGWPDDSVPPTTIRVLRTSGPTSGSVQVVPFHDYVTVVMAAEWGPGNPAEALKAGAVAVKEYAWYHTMFWRGKSAADGSCYDVVDSSLDQVYAPESRVPAPAHLAAVDATWGISIRKAQGLFATHYDAGANVPCGANANGWQLLQVSAVHCAQDGKTAEMILTIYYGPGLTIVGGSQGMGLAAALSFRAQPADATSGTPFQVQPVVAIVDAAGQTVSAGASSDATISLGLAPPAESAALTCTGGLSRAAVAGLATFEGCQVSSAATGVVLVASADGLAPASTLPFSVAPAAPQDTRAIPGLTLQATAATIPWGTNLQLAARLLPPGPEAAAGQALHLQRSTDGVSWATVADLFTDATGAAGLQDRPATNVFYRLAFDGAPDLAPATSPAVPIAVTRVALLRPDSKGAVRRISRGSAVAFLTLVRPIPPTADIGPVEYRLSLLVGGAWVVKRSWTVAPDASGWARLRVVFPSRGSWRVQVMAAPTSTNAASAWSSAQRYTVP